MEGRKAGGDAQGGQMAPVGVVEQPPDLVGLEPRMQGQPDLQAGDVAVAQEAQQALVIQPAGAELRQQMLPSASTSPTNMSAPRTGRCAGSAA